MSLENCSLEDLYREIESRKTAVQAEIRRELEEARRKVRELEAKLGETPHKSGLPKSKLSPGERADRILTALDGRDFTSSQDLAGLVGFDSNTLRETLQSLVSEGKLVREGKARGTKYKLA